MAKNENLNYAKSIAERLKDVQSAGVNPTPSVEPSPAPQVQRGSTESQAGNEFWTRFLVNTTRYATVREKGAAVWLPEEVKERLDKLRMSTVAKPHIRSLAAAIIVTFLDEYEQKVREL